MRGRCKRVEGVARFGVGGKVGVGRRTGAVAWCNEVYKGLGVVVASKRNLERGRGTPRPGRSPHSLDTPPLVQEAHQVT